MLSTEEKQHKHEILELTKEVLQAHGRECDAKISRISEENLQEILEYVRKLWKRKIKINSKSEGESKANISTGSTISNTSVQ